MARDDILTALYGARTAAECDAALDDAEAWLKDHPDDAEVRGACEQASLIRSAWDLPDWEWPQAERDAMLANLGRV